MNSLEVLDVKTALRTTLTQKQELVRDYQSFASTINDTDVAKMYRHFIMDPRDKTAKIKK